MVFMRFVLSYIRKKLYHCSFIFLEWILADEVPLLHFKKKHIIWTSNSNLILHRNFSSNVMRKSVKTLTHQNCDRTLEKNLRKCLKLSVHAAHFYLVLLFLFSTKLLPYETSHLSYATSFAGGVLTVFSHMHGCFTPLKAEGVIDCPLPLILEYLI